MSNSEHPMQVSKALHKQLYLLELFQQGFHPFQSMPVATPLWPSVGVKPNTPKVGDLESSGTLECLEFDRKAQNTSH